MIVTTINVNGVRAAVRERSADNLGLLHWLANTDSDVVCLQEVRADDDQLREALAPALDAGWHLASAEPHLKGRSGVAVLSRAPFAAVRIGLAEFSDHGRYLEVDLADGVTVGSVYVHTGEAGTDRQVEKERFMTVLGTRMAELSADGRHAVLCGDWNIAHKEIDLKNWKGNLKNSGFLPEERTWLTRVFDELGWVDVFRRLDPRPDQYTWWSQRGQARQNNVGWRIDYQIATPGIAGIANAAFIHTADRFSDHAPLVIDYQTAA